MPAPRRGGGPDGAGVLLPDYYATVAADVSAFAARTDGVWVDLGSGSGGLGLALLDMLPAVLLVMMDPDADVLRRGLAEARVRGTWNRVVAIVAPAECIPMPDGSVDAVVSRGSLYFWQDRAQGLREVCRILRPGGQAMIGGGLGSTYPQWARQEFIRRRRESARSPEAAREFAKARSPETFHRLATEAGLPSFAVVGEGGMPADAPHTGIGIWLRFAKEVPHVG